MFESAAHAEGYLAGLIDGEGTVDQPHERRRGRRVSISNTDPAIIEAGRLACEMLGVQAAVYTRAGSPSRPSHWAECFDLVIYGRRNLERLAMLPLAAPEKRRRLEGLLAAYSRGVYTRSEDVPVEVLRRLRLEGHTYASIAKTLGRARATVWRWVQENCPEVGSGKLDLRAKRG